MRGENLVIKRLIFAIALVSMLLVFIGCAGENGQTETDLIDEETMEITLDELDSRNIAEEDVDWDLTSTINDFEEVVWSYFAIGEEEVNGFVAYVKDLEPETLRQFVSEAEEIVKDKYPDLEVTIGGKEARD